jgi:hypothetical protein
VYSEFLELIDYPTLSVLFSEWRADMPMLVERLVNNYINLLLRRRDTSQLSSVS